MASSIAVGAMRQPLAPEEPPYVKLPSAKGARSDRKTTLGESSLHDRDEVHHTLHRRDFVRGRWAVELNDWRAHCVPNGCMVCFLPCVSIAQISVRIGADSFWAALLKQFAFTAVVWALVALELVYCYRYVTSIFGSGTEGTLTPPIVIFSACFVVVLVSCVWVRSLARLRTRVRKRFKIRGSLSDDHCAMAWCTPCAVAQMATQVKSYTPGSCDVYAPEALPAYIP